MEIRYCQRLIITFTALIFSYANTMAQQGDAHPDEQPEGAYISQLYVETRLGFELQRQDAATLHDATGFKGQYLNLRIDGQIIPGLTYSYRQRLNKNTDQRFFDATDWLHLDWAPTDKWKLSAGKQVVGIGGYEYDRAPIDLYYNSEFWYNIPCYQLGISAAYQLSQNDQLLLQVCNSPFRHSAGNNTYGINLMWYTHHGWWQGIWSVNMLEYGRGKWINYLALGNRFQLCRQAYLELDYTNRASSHQRFLFSDCSVVGELSVLPHPMVRCFAKYTYDVNYSGTDADLTVANGTELHSIGGGAEANVLKRYPEALRLFGAVGYSWGQNTMPGGTLQDKGLKTQVGLKFRLDILEATKQIMNHRKEKKQN